MQLQNMHPSNPWEGKRVETRPHSTHNFFFFRETSLESYLDRPKM